VWLSSVMTEASMESFGQTHTALRSNGRKTLIGGTALHPLPAPASYSAAALFYELVTQRPIPVPALSFVLNLAIDPI